MITKDSLISAIKGGMHPEDIYVLLDEATKEVEAEMARLEKQKKIDALMDGMMAYVGRDHAVWEHLDPYEALDSVMYILDEFMAMDSPVANDTKEKCSCGEDCSCNDKIMAKMVVVDENGMHARELSVDEVDDILDKWLSKLK